MVPSTLRLHMMTVHTAFGGRGMNYYFTHTGVEVDQKLIEKINTAQKTLEIAIYALTRNEIVNAIVAAKQRGVVVRVICDREQANSKYELKDMETLKMHQIPVKVNTHSGLMHLKITIIDEIIVALGSYNYTKAATLENDEVLVIVEEESLATASRERFEEMWNDSKRYKNL